jgi:L-ascorbate metabolism protein UlaG (beta-lactamase superfamily)
MIKPFQQDDALLGDIARSRLDAGDGFRLWWLGQSGFLVQWRGKHLLFDPYLSESLTKKYAATEKPHVRMTERVIDPARLGFVDVVTSTHAHTDHLDAETLRALAAAGSCTLVHPTSNTPTVRERWADSGQAVALDAGESADVEGFTVYAVPASHPTLDKDAGGRHLFLGYVVRFGAWTIYHSGDTVVYDGMADVLRPFKIDVAILPINGKVGNMNGADAATLAHDAGAKLVIPCHYEMFEFNTADPNDLFVPTCKQLGQAYRVLRAGEALNSSEVPR